MKGVRGILRVDRKFRIHGPERFKAAYRKRVMVKRVLSSLKNVVSLTQRKSEGLVKVTFHSQVLLLTAQVAKKMRNQRKGRSIRCFASKLKNNHAR